MAVGTPNITLGNLFLNLSNRIAPAKGVSEVEFLFASVVEFQNSEVIVATIKALQRLLDTYILFSNVHSTRMLGFTVTFSAYMPVVRLSLDLIAKWKFLNRLAVPAFLACSHPLS